MPWTKLTRTLLTASFLLTEAGERLLQQTGYKIVLSYGWDKTGRGIGSYSKNQRETGIYTKLTRTEG